MQEVEENVFPGSKERRFGSGLQSRSLRDGSRLVVAFGGCLSKSLCPVPMVTGSRRWGFQKHSPLLMLAQNHAQETPPSHLKEKREALSAPRYAQNSCKEKRSCGAAWLCKRRGSRSPGEEGTLIPVQEKDLMASVDLSLSLYLPGVHWEPLAQRSALATPLPRGPHHHA